MRLRHGFINPNDAGRKSFVGPIFACIEAGFPPSLLLPVQPLGKVPSVLVDDEWKPLLKWQNGVSREALDREADFGANAGLRLGVPVDDRQFMAVDIDVDDKKLADPILWAFAKRLGGNKAIFRRTDKGRGAIVVVVNNILPGRKSIFKLSFEGQLIGRLELLTTNQQMVIAGIHQSNKRIVWRHRDNLKDSLVAPPVADLHVLPDFQALETVVAEVLNELEAKGYTWETTAFRGEGGGADDTPQMLRAKQLIQLVNAFPNPRECCYEQWLGIMMGIDGTIQAIEKSHGPLLQEEEEDITHAVAELSARWQSKNALPYKEGRAKWVNNVRGQARTANWHSLRNHARDLGIGDIALMIEGAATFKAEPRPSREGQEEPTPAERALAEFNEKYMVVNENGRAMVYAPAFEPVLKREYYERIAFQDLTKLHLNSRITIGLKSNGTPITENAAEFWLKHPQRHQYIEGVQFDPRPGANRPGVLNLWRGYALKPVQGDWSLMQSHILNVICDGNQEANEYLLSWMARLLQSPAEQGEIAVVLRGDEGTGKGVLGASLMKITGQHGMTVGNAKLLVGNFNAHLRDCVFLFADEAFFAGDKQHVGVLKKIITDDYLAIEGKYQNAIQAPNFLHILMASNERWVVPASLEARRFFVLDVPQTVKGDIDYFDKLWEQLENGGYEAMLHDLLNRDLSGFKVRKVIKTAGLQEQKKLSLPTEYDWWCDVLQRGFVFRSKLGLENEFAKWHETFSTELLFVSYEEFAADRGERRPLNREGFGRFMRDIGARPCRPRNVITGERRRFQDAEVIMSDRAMAYALGEIAMARAAFEEKTQLPVTWEDEDAIQVHLEDQGFTFEPHPDLPETA